VVGLASESSRLEHNVPARLFEVNIDREAWSVIKLKEGYRLAWPQGSRILHPLGFPSAVIFGSELVEGPRHLKGFQAVRHKD